jgi:hypothetical protein
MPRNAQRRHKACLDDGSKHLKTLLWNKIRWTAGGNMALNFQQIQPSNIIKLTHQPLRSGKRISTHSVLFSNKNSCIFQLEIYSLFYVVWDDHYLFPLFLCECQVLLLQHLNPSVPIQSCKAEKQFLYISFHSADWRYKYPRIVFTFSKLWMNRRNVPTQWHFVYLHTPNIIVYYLVNLHKLG